MPVTSELEKQVKKATKTGKFVVGRKEVLASMKGSKLLIWSASANISGELLEQCKALGIPAIRFDGDPIALGRMCGIPFKVSVIAVRSAGDADLDSFSNSKDYGSLVQSGLEKKQEASSAPAKEPSSSSPAEKEEKTLVKSEETPKKKKQQTRKKKAVVKSASDDEEEEQQLE